MNDKIISITIDDEERMAEVILTFTNEETNKNYVIFEFLDTKEVSAAVYEESTSNEGVFLDIETDEEWHMLEEVLDDYYDSLEEDE